MSRALIKTELDGYQGPVDVSTKDFQDILDNISKRDGFNGEFLENISKKIPSFMEIDRPTTNDKYSWFWGIHFATSKGEVVVLIPWSQDWGKKDGSQSDRAVAIYTKDTANTEDIKSLLTKFGETLKNG